MYAPVSKAGKDIWVAKLDGEQGDLLWGYQASGGGGKERRGKYGSTRSVTTRTISIVLRSIQVINITSIVLGNKAIPTTITTATRNQLNAIV